MSDRGSITICVVVERPDHYCGDDLVEYCHDVACHLSNCLGLMKCTVAKRCEITVTLEHYWNTATRNSPRLLTANKVSFQFVTSSIIDDIKTVITVSMPAEKMSVENVAKRLIRWLS